MKRKVIPNCSKGKYGYYLGESLVVFEAARVKQSFLL